MFLTSGDAVKTAEMDTFLTETRGRERDFIKEVLRSRKVAWVVAGGFAAVTVLALGVTGVQVFESSQPVPPFILRVDNATGQTDVVSVMKTRTDTYGEVMDQHWLAEYVRRRESYDWQTIQGEYNATGLLSSPDVATDYRRAYFEGDTARDRVLADKARIIVSMESAPVLTPGTRTAAVRFTTTTRWKGGQPEQIRHWIATIGFAYVNSAMKPEDRLINPLGFQVTSYTLSPELGVTGDAK